MTELGTRLELCFVGVLSQRGVLMESLFWWPGAIKSVSIRNIEGEWIVWWP